MIFVIIIYYIQIDYLYHILFYEWLTVCGYMIWFTMCVLWQRVRVAASVIVVYNICSIKREAG